MQTFSVQQAAAANEAEVAAASAPQSQLQQPADAHQQQFNNILIGVAGKNSIFLPFTIFQTPTIYISI